MKLNSKKTFRIWYNVNRFAWKDVEARTIEEAEKIAEASDGCDFNFSQDDDWVLDKSYNREYNEAEIYNK
jgi:hypothetical protein